LKTKQLPDGRTAVYTAEGEALSSIGAVSTAMNNLNGKTATTYINTIHNEAYRSFRQSERDFTNKRAHGGRLRRYADGGDVQIAPNGLISGPGTGTSDSILAMFASGAVGRISDTEYVVNARSTSKYLPLLEAINDDRLKIPGFAKGGGVRSLARGARDEIRAATSGSTERNLLRLMDAISRGHIKMASALKQVTSALDKAKDKLGDLKSAASQLSNSVKSGVLSASDITRGASGDKPTTVSSIMGGLIQSRDKATAFADALKRLRKRGLSNSLLKQVAEAGIEGGGLETAGALLRASGSELKSINSLQSQIAGAAGSAGKTTADALYGSQIKAQEKLVKSLDRLADVMKAVTAASSAREKAKKKAKKKAAGGIAGGLTWVGEYEPELLELPYGSRVHSGPDSRRIAASGGGSGGRPIVLNVSLAGRDFGQIWVDVGRKEVSTRGGLTATFGGL
jgi:hypothetical protein